MQTVRGAGYHLRTVMSASDGNRGSRQRDA